MMKKITSQFFSVVVLCLVLLISNNSNAQVGINTTTPTEMLDVNGNLKLNGAFMPGNAFGGVDQILISKGSGTPPAWGPGFINTTEISSIAKYYLTPVTVTCGSRLTASVADTSMTAGTVVSVSIIGPAPAGTSGGGCSGANNLFYGDNFRIMTEPQNGQLLIHFTNNSTRTVTNLYLALVIYYK